MLLTIHNLPIRTQYSDVKELIVLKCGLKDSILDNLQVDGSGMQVTVGVVEEEDAALLVRKINGLYYKGQQLYVEKKRQTRESEQPYRTNMAQPQPIQQPQMPPIYDYSQLQAMGHGPWQPNQAMGNYMYQPQLAQQAVQNAIMAYGHQQYSETLVSQYSGNINQQDNGHQGYSQHVFQQQAGDQSVQNKNLYTRRLAPTESHNKTDIRWDNSSPNQGERQRAAPVQGQARTETRWEDSCPNREERRRPVPVQGETRTETRRDESFPNREERRRPASPSRHDWQNTQPEPKRSKWDSRPERSHRNFEQDRFREERGQNRFHAASSHDSNLRSGRFDVRPKNASSRWDQSSQRAQLPERRDRFDHPDRRDAPNRRDQPVRRNEPVRRDQSNRRDQPTRPSHETEPSSQNPEPEFSKELLKSIKFNKSRAMREAMFDTIRNLKAQSTLSGPSALKSTLRMAVIARIDKLVGSKDMPFEEIMERYRTLYPESEDNNMYTEMKREMSVFQHMKGEDLKVYVRKYVYGERRDKPNYPPRPAAPAGKDNVSHSASKPIGPFPNSREYRLKLMIYMSPIFYDTAKNLDLVSQLAKSSVLKSIIKKTITDRIRDIVQHMKVQPMEKEMLSEYRRKYPANTDADLYAKIKQKLTEKENMTVEEISDFVSNQIMSASNPPLNLTPVNNTSGGSKGPISIPSGKPQGEVAASRFNAPKPPFKPPNMASGNRGPVPAPQKIPNYPQGDKKLHSKQKKQHKLELETLEGYDVNPIYQKAIDAEVEAIGAMIAKEFKLPRTEEERLMYAKLNQDECVVECKKFVNFHICKRITNGGAKLARIYGHPYPPKKPDLEKFLYEYNCLSLKKSVKSPFFTASFESFETLDLLCNISPIAIGNGISVTFKQMHIAPKKPKYSQKNWKNLRKKYIRSLIDDRSRVNLLDKDWQVQEEEEKSNRERKEQELDEVIYVGNEEIKTVDITGDDPMTDENKEQKININNNAVAAGDQSFLHEEFKVIDEVKESDNDDNEVQKGKDGEGNEVEKYDDKSAGKEVEKDKDNSDDNQVVDDWDQTGDDWDDITGVDENVEGDINMAAENRAEDNAVAIDDKEFVAENNAAAVDDNEFAAKDNAVAVKDNAVAVKDNAVAVKDNGVAVVDNQFTAKDNAVAVNNDQFTAKDIKLAIKDDGSEEDDEDNYDDEDASANVEDIDINNVDWDNVDEDDLEDY